MFLRPASNASRIRGVGLIEVLIAVLILSIGLLGIAAMQAVALRNGQSALSRSYVTMQIYSMFDAMRANREVARQGGYGMARTCAVPTASGTDPLYAQDQAAWLASLQAGLGTSACGTITCSVDAGLRQYCVVTVDWNDDLGTNTGGNTEVAVETQTVALRTEV